MSGPVNIQWRMMATGVAVLTAALAAGSLVAQERLIKIPAGTGSSYVRLEEDGSGFRFEAGIASVKVLEDPELPGYARLLLRDYYSGGDPGSPSLPVKSVLFEAGRRQVTGIRIVQLDSVVVDLNQVAMGMKITPAVPSVQKASPPPVPVPDSTVYQRDRFNERDILSAAFQGRMRGIPLSLLDFKPVRYNPVQNKLIIYRRVEAIVETQPAGKAYRPGDRAFSSLLDNVAVAVSATHKAIRSEGPMTLVVLSDTVFREALEPLVSWKTRRGFRVVEAYVQDPAVGGTRESIKSYLKELYEQPPEGMAPPAYLLIVGDVDQVPASQSPGELTDLYYAEYDGQGDYIPDLFYGRISVENAEQLDGVVQKILQYEQFRFPDPSFLARTILIAGVDARYAPTYGNGHINYAHEYYLNADRGFETHLFRYPQSDTSAGRIRELISQGAGLVNYTGHGTWNAWNDPAFTKGDIGELENTARYPVVVGNGCETNYFAISECFAEAILRAPGKGAVAYIGCTNDSYWLEDYYWAVGAGPVRLFPGYDETSTGFYDKVFHVNGEPYEAWTPSLGEMVFGGNMAVQQSDSHRKRLYWEIYQLAGDPTLMPWFGIPAEQHVVHPGILPPATGRIDISCPANSYLAVSLNGLLLDARHASPGGTATLYLPDTLTGDTLDLVVYSEGARPYTGLITMAPPGGAYLDLLSCRLSGESVEGDQEINPREHAGFDLVFVNRGDAGLGTDTLLLQTGHPSIEVLDSVLVLGNLGPGDTLELVNIFRISASGWIEDQDRAFLGLSWKGTGHMHHVTLKLSAPVLRSEGFFLNDHSKGNGNGVFEAGEKIKGSWRITNTGHYRSSYITPAVAGSQQIPVGVWSFTDSLALLPGESGTLPFDIQLGSKGPGWQGSGHLLASGPDSWVEDSFRLVMDRHYEDFGLGRISDYPFVNDPDSPWIPDSTIHDSPGYSFRSGRTGHNQASRMSVSFRTDTAGTLDFSFRVSSEYSYDFLVLEVDSNEWSSWSGETGWRRYSLKLNPGEHTISWIYRKDRNTSTGDDAAWVDDISFPAGAFSHGDVGIMEIVAPVSGPWLSDHESPVLRVRNHGSEPVRGFTAGFWLDGLPAGVETYPDTLWPGADVRVQGTSTLDLSGPGTYELKAKVFGDTLAYAGNNVANKTLVHHVYPDLSVSLLEVDQVAGTFARAKLHVENKGNISVDSFRIEVSLEGQLLHSSSRTGTLPPGGYAEFAVPLIDSSQTWPQGNFNFAVAAVLTDSVPENNLLMIPLEWAYTGTGHGALPVKWQVYPNPVRSVCYVSMEGAEEREVYFQLCDLSGRVLRTFKVIGAKGPVMVPTASLASGVYVIRRVHTGDQKRILVLPEPSP